VLALFLNLDPASLEEAGYKKPSRRKEEESSTKSGSSLQKKDFLWCSLPFPYGLLGFISLGRFGSRL
jgi:hypothetical protein